MDNLLVRIHLITEMTWWTGLAPWESELPFPGSLESTFLAGAELSPTASVTEHPRQSVGGGKTLQNLTYVGF